MAAPTFVAATRPSTPWATSGATTKTTASFAVTAGDLLVLLAAAEDGGQTFSGITGGGLTWTQAINVGIGGATSRTAIWTATASSTTSITAALTISDSAAYWGFVVHQYRNHDGVGASTSQNTGTTSAPSLALTTTAANSAISYINGDWNAADGTTRTWRTINSITPTTGNGLETDYYRDAGGAHYGLYAGYWSDVGAAGSKTTGLSAPSTQRPTIGVIEIKGTASAAATSLPLRRPHPFLHMLIR